ncbi:hypothetical protein TL16_g11376 [Triparma laevis f. inornata]|uniref:Uncharacterized protein n=1 Tax=Triparma laevis f. inornata TaxID=1714386 RepID=A0A9W7BE81_9STRA|nr:hypothetical protein TL16_g11376 [Triparma laevis f. inornata]
MLVDNDALYLDQSSDSSYAHSITNVGFLDGCTNMISSAITTEDGSIDFFYNCYSNFSTSEYDADVSFPGVSSSFTQFRSQSANETARNK